MRTDLLSKRIFTAGCFGLPWLWIVHAWYWRNHVESPEDEQQQGLLNADDHFPEDATPVLTPEEIKLEAQKWVHRCQYCAAIVCTLWIGWIVTSQVLRVNGMLPASLFMLNADDQALTGW
ncbi:hypothetical protein MPSEU_000622900 [Mayamaea pseudoterrestris]|nr:hypothetical protein MPSEU_000622900 [Mayamaea pseudoterrestris]